MVRVHGAQHVRKTWIVSATAASEVHLLDYLLTHGVDVNTRAQYGESPLGAAAAAGQMEAARHLIARGARLDNRPLITLETPLIEAARMNHMDMVQLLMAYGADPSARDVWQHPTNVAIDRVSIEGLPDDSPNSFGIVEGFGVGFNVVNGIVYTGELPRSSTLGIYTS